jgi:ADP-heptose:LPS heptosyltransferase
MPHTILVVLFGDLGDTLLTVPAFRAVRRRFPDSTMLVLAKNSPGQYLRDLGLVDDVIDVDKHALDRIRSLANPITTFRLLRLAWSLHRQRVDQLIIFQHFTTVWGSLKYGMVAAVSGASVRAGLDNGRGWFLSHRVRDRGFGAVHETQYWLEVAALVGAKGEAVLEVAISDSDARAADLLLHNRGLASGQILAVHPGVGWYGPGRQWGADRFAEAVRLVLQEHPMHCIVVGTQTDRLAADAVVARLGHRVVDLVGMTTTGQLASVLRRCDLLVSNDGGVAHLAAAAQARTLTVFGPSNDAAWHPLHGDVISVDLPCRPCFYRDFEIGLRRGCATRECLTQITPAQVAARALALLGVAPVGP